MHLMNNRFHFANVVWSFDVGIKRAMSFKGSGAVGAPTMTLATAV